MPGACRFAQLFAQGRSLSDPHLSEAGNTAVPGTGAEVAACEVVCGQKRGGSQQWLSYTR